jgi:hypothetical protein
MTNNNIVQRIMLLLLSANNNEPVQSDEKLHCIMLMLSRAIPALGEALNDWEIQESEPES